MTGYVLMVECVYRWLELFLPLYSHIYSLKNNIYIEESIFWILLFPKWNLFSNNFDICVGVSQMYVHDILYTN